VHGVCRILYRRHVEIIIIIIIIITAIEFSLGVSGPYSSTDETNKSKYT
jgi:hypothetical protein